MKGIVHHGADGRAGLAQAYVWQNGRFGVAWSAHRSLVAITGKDFRYDAVAWGAYLSGPEKPFG